MTSVASSAIDVLASAVRASSSQPIRRDLNIDFETRDFSALLHSDINTVFVDLYILLDDLDDVILKL